MDWRINRLVLTLALSLGAASCAAPEPGKVLYIDSSFTDEDVEIVLDAIGAWNEVGRDYVGEELIKVGGLYEDPNGLHPMSDLGDGRCVVYDASGAEDELIEHGTTVGIGLSEDILIFAEKLREFLAKRGQENDYPQEMEETAKHELGHWLGLPDEFDPEKRSSMMYHTTAGGPDITDDDIRNICKIYGCVQEP